MTNDKFTNLFKIHIDNDRWTYNAIMDKAREIIEDNCEYPVIELADFLESEIFDFFCSCSDENLLLMDVIDAAKTEIDFDGLAQGYIDEAREEAA